MISYSFKNRYNKTQLQIWKRQKEKTSIWHTLLVVFQQQRPVCSVDIVGTSLRLDGVINLFLSRCDCHFDRVKALSEAAKYSSLRALKKRSGQKKKRKKKLHQFCGTAFLIGFSLIWHIEPFIQSVLFLRGTYTEYYDNESFFLKKKKKRYEACILPLEYWMYLLKTIEIYWNLPDVVVTRRENSTTANSVSQKCL